MFYIQGESEPRRVESGDKLGEMTDELHPFKYIEESVCGGPINYAYEIVNRNSTWGC